MHEVLVNRLGGLSLPRKSVVRLTDRPDMTLDVYRGHKTTIQQQLTHMQIIPYILYYQVYNSNCYQVGHNLIDHFHCTDAFMPEHEALPLSKKMCLQIVAVTFICSGKE